MSTPPNADFRLSPQQLAFYETFGFLRLPRLFAEDIDAIIAAFEAGFVEGPTLEMSEDVHFGMRRVAAPGIVERSARLRELIEDPRIVGIVRSVFGDTSEWAGSDGNLMWCDTAWHCDLYGSPIDRYHLKLFFYLDPVDARSGGLRVIPGTHFYAGSFARGLRQKVSRWQDVEGIFGVRVEDLPSVAVPSEPGDVILGNFRTLHATFGGGPRRRLLTMNFRDARPEGAPRPSGDVAR